MFMIKKHCKNMDFEKPVITEVFNSSFNICLSWNTDVSLFSPDNVAFNLSVCIFLALKSTLFLPHFHLVDKLLSCEWVRPLFVIPKLQFAYLISSSEQGISIVIVWRCPFYIFKEVYF